MNADRTLTHWMSSVTLVLAYVASVIMLQAAFRVLSGQQSQLAVVVSTLVIAFLLNPLRKRIQSSINRWLNRRNLERSSPT